MTFCILCEAIFQFIKTGINIQIAVETDGKHAIFQNHESFVNLNFKTSIQKASKLKIEIPIIRNSILFDMINSLLLW